MMRGIMIAVWAGIGLASCGYMCSSAPPPTPDDTHTKKQTVAAHIICDAIKKSPDGLTCTVDDANRNIHATLLRYPNGGSEWCHMYRDVIRTNRLEMDGWLIHTYVDDAEKPAISCMLG